MNDRQPSIVVDGVSLAYEIPVNATSSAKEYLINLVKRRIIYEKFWALHDVDLELHRGEVLGIIGPNGAGKSTLMKVLAGVLPPTTGRVIVRGTVSPMIEVSGGMNGELTGRENIVLVGALLARSPRLMRERVPAIAEWAGLSDFLDVPVRTYSTGMRARLGFAIATDRKPDVLLIDEVLSVGDESFRGKSLQRIRDLMDGGTTVVMVSHALAMVERLCRTVMWLDRGRVKAVGPAEEIIAAYREAV